MFLAFISMTECTKSLSGEVMALSQSDITKCITLVIAV